MCRLFLKKRKIMETDEKDVQTLMKHIEDLHKENQRLTEKLKVVHSVSDRLLSAEEAATVLKVSKDWIYRRQRWKTLPFTVVLSERKILFSLKGILKYLEEKQHAGSGVQEG
jgi:predicted DNA-binding transcriptional regulator AlpA